jgi:murein DD-endopeptidase MepM/ murein hydrolase activator NlpD
MRVLSLTWLVLASRAIAAPEVRYYQPFQHGEVRRVTCAWEQGSHADEWNRYSIDYDLPVGTPVVAAADGVVVAVEDRFRGPDGDAAHNNQVAIRHADGRVSVYLHLREKGVVVRVDQEVMRGDLLGYSGDTGAASGPHLHFGVQERLGGASVPFRFADFGGDGVPKHGNLVTSFNFPERYEPEYHEIEATLTFFGIARKLGCIEAVADRLVATSRIGMPMPLKVLEEMLARRDAALREYEQLAEDALREASGASGKGDVATAVRLLAFGRRDHAKARAAHELDRAWSELRKQDGYAAAWATLEGERTYRRLLSAAIRAHMKVGNVIREGKFYLPAIQHYEAALRAAPEGCRGDLARLVAELKALR